ncbi:MAG: peptidylprolyl isomerase [Planctomycetota bacterium]|jgi:peptidyl-prolyl cis-trans isomerase C
MRSYPRTKCEILLCLAIIIVSFGSVASSEPNTVTPDSNGITPVGEGVAVTVNGVDITEGEVQLEVARELARGKISPQMQPQIVEQMRRRAREQVIDRLIGRLLVNERVEQEAPVTDEEVIAHLRRIGAAQRPPLSLEDIRKRIEVSGQTFDQVKENIRRGLGYQRLMEPQWAGRVNITEDDAKKYYEENPTLFESPERVRASHILIKPDASDPNRDPNETKAEAKAEAEELLGMIRDGNDFATLAREHSDCPSARRGGDLGFERRRGWVKPFADVAFSLKVGQVSDIVETRWGYHIIRTSARKEPSIMTFEQTKDRIINELVRRRRDEIAKEYVDSLKEEANIVYPPGKEPKVSRPPVIRPPKPPPVDSNTPAGPPEDANAVQ